MLLCTCAHAHTPMAGGCSICCESLASVADSSSETMMSFTPSRPIRRAQSTYFPPLPVRHLEVLTSTTPQPSRGSSLSLPEPVQTLIVVRRFSAMRAWRTHRGLSMASMQARTDICLPTLLALDRGDVGLCEWTVNLLAKALRVEPSLLLTADKLAAYHKDAE